MQQGRASEFGDDEKAVVEFSVKSENKASTSCEEKLLLTNNASVFLKRSETSMLRI